MKIDAKKMEMKSFLASFFTAFLLDTQTYALREPQISAAKTKKKRKKDFWSAFGVSVTKRTTDGKKKRSRERNKRKKRKNDKAHNFREIS